MQIPGAVSRLDGHVTKILQKIKVKNISDSIHFLSRKLQTCFLSSKIYLFSLAYCYLTVL